ncbi:hypothetical protein ARMGADRAFT_1036015 [Armillaria gallica]|uniref:Uncharacterized protein n=1 Tax=Armillaria gallica TaxID=47427 RepID=A0A2H3CWH6_ARMGA|nr:hypothetical protein ARMGADRAFT_1036015 [Armillaria gallica]
MPVPMNLDSFKPQTKALPTGPHSHQDMTKTLLQELNKESHCHIRFTHKDVDKFLESCEPAKLNDRPPPLLLDLHLLNLGDEVSEGLPVYHASVQECCKFLGKKAKPVLVDTILDMAAPDNYDVAGTDYTTTVAFAKLTLQIGDIKDTTLAYILEEDSGFRYDLLLRRNWMSCYQFRPQWEDNSFFLTLPKTHVIVHIQAICSPICSPSPPENQAAVSKVKDLYTLDNTLSDENYSDLPDLMDVEDSNDEDEEDNREDYYVDDDADYDEPLKPCHCSEDITHPPEPMTQTTKCPCKLGQFAKKLKDTVSMKFPRLFRRR